MTLVTVPRIVTEADNEAALDRIAQLMGAEPGSPEEAELDVLATLVHAFEIRAYPIGLPSPQAALRFVMEQHGLAQKDLVPIFPSVSRVSEFLAGKRSLSKEQAVGLYVRFGVPFEVLLGVPSIIAGETEKRSDDKGVASLK